MFLGKKGNMKVVSVKNKIKCLRSYLKCSKRKSRSASQERYMSKWFAYKALKFLKDITTTKEIRESEEHEYLSFNDFSSFNIAK